MPKRAKRGHGIYRYSNWQWRITRRGLATHSADYFIEKARLPHTREYNGAVIYVWPLHMAEKAEWCIGREFNSAFEAAMRIHFRSIDSEMFSRTLSAICHQKNSWHFSQNKGPSAQH